MSTNAELRKDLLRYLLTQVKREELDVDRAKEFIRAIGEPARERDEPVAVVGLACRFPGAANKDEFWRNLVEGRESIGEFPPSRLADLRRVEGSTEAVRRGGYLDRVDLFDAEYFGIPPHDATALDPYHRNLMEVLVEAMEDAGHSRDGLRGTTTGVFVGNDHTHRLITSYLPFLSEMDFSAVTGSWSGILASRLSYLFDFRGPASVIDTGCSSGLVAVDAAVKAIRAGDCDSAFVGAVNLFLSPSSLGNETESDEFQVRAFDASANGTVWSEGVGAVYLKPLSRARADGDHVYGVLLGGAVNNDGRSNGLTAPNAQAQKNLLVGAWRRAGISPESLSYVEAHGTGTELGDPIEIKGLTSAFAEFTDRRQFCALGSVKSNIGHTVGAAGLASLIKTLLCLDRRVIPPSLHFDVPNKFLDLANAPVYVCDRLTEWEEGPTPRRAGVSAFSLSGTNCHLVVEEAPPATRPDGDTGFQLLPLSARDGDLLARTAARLADHLDTYPDLRVDDVGHTLRVGREHHDVRAVVLARTREDLLAGLRALADDERANTPLPDGGLVATDGTALRAVLADEHRALAASAAAFLAAAPRPFADLPPSPGARRVPLPAQLLRRVRHWDETVRPGATDQQPEHDPVAALRARVADLDTALDTDPAEPDGAARDAVRLVWSQVLGYPDIQGTDDFFGLGGDSISSVKITQLLNSAFWLDVPLSALLATPTFDEFADVVINGHGLDLDRVRARLAAERARGTSEAQDYELPLTAAQRGMFVTHQIDENSLAYNVSGLMLSDGFLDAAELERCLTVLVARHDSLRSSFPVIGGQPFQRVHAQVPIAVEHRPLPPPAPGQTHESVARTEMADFVRPFRLDSAPLFRFGLFEFTDGVTGVAIDIHHIVTDGTSMGILFRDLAAIADGTPLPPLVPGYRAAVRGLLERQNATALAPHRAHWLAQFDDEVPALQLTTDWQRSETSAATGATLFTSIDGDTLAAATRFARERGLTLYMVLLGVFQQLLSRLSGQHDVVIGAPVHGRPELAYQDLVGMFVATLPLRVRAEPTDTVGEFLAGLRTTVLDAFEHQDYPLDLLIEDLGPPRIAGRRPLFDVCFVHQNTDLGLEQDGERLVEFDDGSARYDITLSTRESGGKLLLEWEYSTGLFRAETIELYAERFARLLRSVLAAADSAPLGELDLLPDRERELLTRLATGDAPVPVETSIAGLFEAHAHAAPEKTALVLGGETLTYGELNARANRVAHSLIGRGVAPHSPVALLMDRSFEMITAILGVLKARCHYVPLNTEFPVERLRAMVEDAGAVVLIASGNRLDRAGELASDRLRVTDVPSCLAASDDERDPGLGGDSADEIYVMYTSGTSGAPKGSVARQRAVLRVAHQAVFYPASAEDVFLMHSDYSFDGSVYDMFGALTNGGTLVLVDRESLLDLDRLGAIIQRHQVTSFFITTALYNTLIDNVADSLGSVRRLVFGGEVASPVHVRRGFERLGPGRLAHAYGPTETTVFATVHVLETFDENDAIPIGRPVNDTSLWVLDENLAPRPVGVGGELYIGGSGLADGYLNKPDLTARRFVTVDGVPAPRLYRTGDIVTMKSNGLLYYTGRIDQQIKLRGYRIELAEIIHAAVAQPYVAAAHAGLHEAGQAKNLCLWVVFADGTARTAELRAALRRTLPAFMVPSFVVATDTLPLNKNGKVDTAALPVPGVTTETTERPEPDEKSVGPVAAAWSYILGVPVIDADTSFFDLGGDSIKAIQVVARLKENDIVVQVADLLSNPSVRSLEKLIAAAGGAGAGAGRYDTGPHSGPLTPSPVQREFLADPANHTRVFTHCLVITLDEPVTLDRLTRAVARLVGHHDLLRLRIDGTGGLSVREVDTPRHDLLHVEWAPAGLTEPVLTDYLSLLQRIVDPLGGPVVSAAAGLGQRGDEVAIAVHHLAVDVVSWGVLLADLHTFLADPDAPAPTRTIPFPRWTDAVRARAERGGFRTQLPYWLELARAAAGTGPLFDAEPVARRDTASRTVLLTESDGFSLVESVRERYGAGPADAVVAVVGRALAAVSGSDRVLLGLEGHGREPIAGNHDLTGTVGWLTCVYPHLVRVGGDPADTVDVVRRSFDRLPDRGAGFGPLLAFDTGLGTEHDELAALRPQVSLNYLGAQDMGGGSGIRYLSADVTIDPDHRSPHVVEIIAAHRDRGLEIELRCPRDWDDDGRAAGLAAALDTAFREVRDAVRTAGNRGFRTSSSISQGVLANILTDVLTEVADEVITELMDEI